MFASAWLPDFCGNGAGVHTGPAAIAGYPHVTVPAGLHKGLPVGLSFFGAALSEAKLVRLAAGFEHAAQARVPAPLRNFA